jgi:excinuclease ABC subunit B
MYADKMTEAMQEAIDETNRRREIQHQYNVDHSIEPASIVKSIHDLTERVKLMRTEAEEEEAAAEELTIDDMSVEQLERMVKELEAEMKQAAKMLEFEKAAILRDQIMELRQTMVLHRRDRRHEGQDLSMMILHEAEQTRK